MAIVARRFHVTREQVYKLITAWKLSVANGGTATIEDFIRTKVAALNLPDDDVDTTGHENLDDATKLAEMIIMDLHSYSNSPYYVTPSS